jgi:hypothetical protein
MTELSRGDVTIAILKFYKKIIFTRGRGGWGRGGVRSTIIQNEKNWFED